MNYCTLGTHKDKRQVLFNGMVIAEFDVMSDDYAYTHASEFASLFSDKFAETKDIEESKQFAWSKL